jgi:hypothetical protein
MAVKVKESLKRPSVAQRVPGGGGEAVSLTHLPPLPPGNVIATHFPQGLGRPQGHGTVRRNMSLKNPATPPRIDPMTTRLLRQCLNHYATPGAEVMAVVPTKHMNSQL